MYKRLFIGALATFAISTNVMAHGACEARPLHDDMVGIQKKLKAMSGSLKSGDNEQAAINVEQVITLFKNAREQTPYLFVEKKLSGDELAKEMAEYQSVIDDTIVVFTSLETALENNDSAKIKSLMGQIGKQKHIGHSNFKADC
ncbi:cytochrome b562 [Marinomonas pollencensis]|uniref:Cytochrome b562 n=1 Tax=Marinomonas pollencensis TaxID=491954 RepID=A0A3E0DTB0_9GAMM|nr:cytochrome b562 [Marinomonas pollencensis]REG85736.1 cytochrome b562 [Marinomonas pollencensis]